MNIGDPDVEIVETFFRLLKWGAIAIGVIVFALMTYACLIKGNFFDGSNEGSFQTEPMPKL